MFLENTSHMIFLAGFSSQRLQEKWSGFARIFIFEIFSFYVI